MNWTYKGYHAWFGVKVAIEKFVIRGGAVITETLQSASAARCCTAPSGGFNYQGTTRFEVQKDDVYGFRMTGSNDDTDASSARHAHARRDRSHPRKRRWLRWRQRRRCRHGRRDLRARLAGTTNGAGRRGIDVP